MEPDRPVAQGFDTCADRYADMINVGARASGETYEYMVKLRVGLFMSRMKDCLDTLARPTLLDFGCGTGATIEALAGKFPTAALHGFDTSAESIVCAVGRHIPGAEFHHMSAVPLPFPDNNFDAIYSNGTFHHIPKGERTVWLSELLRVLKGGGRLMIFENNPLNPLMMQAMRRTPFDVDADPVGVQSLVAAMTVTGFRVSRPCYYFFFPRWLKWLRGTEKLLSCVPLGAQYFVLAEKSGS